MNEKLENSWMYIGFHFQCGKFLRIQFTTQFFLGDDENGVAGVCKHKQLEAEQGFTEKHVDFRHRA
jgi:hypothetical protein